jgi:hypothetical protein
MRKHIIFEGLTAVVLLCFLVGPSFARFTSYQAKHDRPLNPKRTVLHMFQTEDDGSWDLTRRAARGKLTYRLWGETFDFFFQGRHLVPKEDYVLVYIPESPDSPEFLEQTYEGAVELGRAKSDRRGRLYMVDSVDTCLMPAARNSSSEVVGHVWLVLESALDYSYYYDEIDLSRELSAEYYIAGFHSIRFMDTDGCGEEIVPYYEEPDDPVEEDPGDDEPVVPIGPY